MLGAPSKRGRTAVGTTKIGLCGGVIRILAELVQLAILW